MPRWPNSAVAARNASDWVRPVVCDVGGPMWAPITSGGISIEAPRWIVWRSSASLQSLVHTRSVRCEDPVVDPRPARRAALDLDVGMARAQLVEQPVQRQRLGVRAGRAVGAGALRRGRGSCPT